VTTLFQRPDRVAQPLDVILTVFNSARFRTRWKHYQDFVSMAERAGSAVRLWTVEVAFGERAFAVTEKGNPRHLQLRTNCEIWHKERSQNIMLSRVVTEHPDCKYIAFADADITFARHDWADETLHALQHHSVVQMWSEAYDLDANGNIIHSHKSFCWCHDKRVPPGKHGYCEKRKQHFHWHPGFAWAYRREVLDHTGGLIDFAILGSADFHMAYALIGNALAGIRGDNLNRPDLTRRSPGFARKLLRWETLARAAQQNIGFVNGSILHHWHGPKHARGYDTRYKIYESSQFDPERDLVADTQGLYHLVNDGSARSNRLRDDVRRYFHQRNEDAL
jgi:hypothetical protein